MLEVDGHVIVEEAPNRTLDLCIVVRSHDLGRTAGELRRDLAAADDLDARLENMVRRTEHCFDIGLRAIDREIRHRAGRQPATIGESEDPGRPGTCHDGDLGQAVFALETVEDAELSRGRMDAGEARVAEIAFHQQPHELRITREGSAIRVIGGQEDPPGVLDEEKEFETDCPLQRVDEVLLTIAERHQSAARIAFDIHRDPFIGLGMAAVAELRLRVAGLGHGWPEDELADIDADVAVAIDGVGNARCRRGEAALALGAVAVELDMRQMDREAFGRIDRRQCRLDIARGRGR